MKKMIFTVFTLVLFFITPTVVFASEDMLNHTNTENMMKTDHGIDCTEFNVSMLKEHRLEIIDRLISGEISQEQAIEHIKHINQMIKLHR